MEYRQGSGDKSVHVHTTPDDWSDADGRFRPSRDAHSQRPQRPPQSPQAPQVQQAAEALGGLLGRSVCVVAGLALTLIGIPMLILPGPGLLTLATGAALLGAGLAPSTSARITRC